MKTNKFKNTTEKILSLAGININGNAPWDIKVHNEKVYQRVLAGGSLAIGESYMDGWWDCKALDQLVYRVLKAEMGKGVKISLHTMMNVLKARIFNLQRKSKSYEIGKRHYDIGNNLYKNMLDKRMNYSCGYWKNAKTLDEAQEAKLDLICKKINLKPDMTVLDIGCGWGGFAKYAAERYKVKVVGITVSKEQVKLARELCRGLPVEIRLQDYRGLKEKFDRVVSVGMIEHVGYKNYKNYMKIVYNCLKPGGLFLLQTIGGNKSVNFTEPWINKYIFPNGTLPSAKQITTASEGLFVLEDWHSFGKDYDKTLMVWYSNFKKNWDKIKKNYNERFYRMWTYFLLMFVGGFRSEKYQLWQIVFSKKGVIGEYISLR